MKKDDTSGLLAVALMFGLPLCFFASYWEYILIAAAVVAVIYGFCRLNKSKETDSIINRVEYAYIIGRTECMEMKSRPSGYSISSSGNARAYWKYQKEIDHVDIEFEVHNTDGTVHHVTTREGSSLYKGISPYVRIKPEPVVKAWNLPAKELPNTVEAPKNECLQDGAGCSETEQNLPPVQSASYPVSIQGNTEQPANVEAEKPTPKSKKEERYYADIPFEITPNEFNLQISYPSCQLVKRADGEHRIYIRFGVTYDPTVKGVRNRVIMCATVDEEGRMTAVQKEWKVLDLSGSKLVEIMFSDNAEQEPARIIVGLDRYN